MTLDDLVAEFGTRTGLGTLRLNGEGVCRLVFDGELTVDVESGASGREFTLSATLGSLDPEAGRAVLMKLLDANLMGRGTNGAALALDVITDEVVLCRTLPLDGLTYGAFEAALEGFVQAAERWTDEIEADDGAVEEEDAAEDGEASAERPEETMVLRL